MEIETQKYNTIYKCSKKILGKFIKTCTELYAESYKVLME